MTVISGKVDRQNWFDDCFLELFTNTYWASDKTKKTKNNTKQASGLALLRAKALIDFPMDFKLPYNNDSLKKKNHCRFVVKITTAIIWGSYTHTLQANSKNSGRRLDKNASNMGKQQLAEGGGGKGGGVRGVQP